MRTGVAREKMTAEQAKSFGGRYSIFNAAEVCKARPCGCEPYVDVFTFKRWIAQGMVVRKGEKAIKLPLVKDVEDKNGEKSKRILGSSAVFCRHQVEQISKADSPWKRDQAQAAADRDAERFYGTTDPAAIELIDQEQDSLWIANHPEIAAANAQALDAVPAQAERAAEQYAGWKPAGTTRRDIGTPQVPAMPGMSPLGMPKRELPTIKAGSDGVLFTEIDPEPTVKRIDLDGIEHDTFIREGERDEAQAPLF